VVVAPGRNVGRACARNLGWRRARGRWVLFLDDDILAPPGLLAAHLAELRTGPGVGTIGPAVTDPAIIDAPHFRYVDTRGVAKLPAGPAPGKYFVTQNAAVPRGALARIGGFDEDFAAYGFEDMDLGFRLEDVGIRFRVLPRPVPLHIHHHTLREYLEKKRTCARGSLQAVARRHPHRLAEMRLDLVIDPPGGRPSGAARLARMLLDGTVGARILDLAARWPVTGAAAPRWPRLYARVMDAAILTCYRQGLKEGGGKVP